MKTINSILKISAKYQIREMRNRTFFSPKLSGEIVITKKLFYHIVASKPRPQKESAERLAILPLIPETLKKGELTESRDNGSHKIIFEIQRIEFAVILYPQNEKWVVVSCFRHRKKESCLSL